MNAAEAWLREHLAEAPAELLEAMCAVIRVEADSVPEALAAGALTLYANVGLGDGGREEALPLLAADALLTHAFEAQAEVDPAGLGQLAERWGAGGRISALAE